MRNHKKLILFVSCIIVVICGLIGFSVEHKLYHNRSFLFYTVISNLVAVVMCTAVAAAVAFDKMNNTLWKLHFIVACMMAFTLGVVLLGSLIFTNNYLQYFLSNGDWALHLICPLLVITNHYIFCPKNLTVKFSLIPIIITTCYGIVMYILNGLGAISGPYFFFEIQQIGIFQSIHYGFVMVIFCVGLTLAIYIPKRNNGINCNSTAV